MKHFVKQTHLSSGASLVNKPTVIPPSQTLPTAPQPDLHQSVREQFGLVAQYMSGYKGQTSFNISKGGSNLRFVLKPGQNNYYLSFGTMSDYNMLQTTKTYTFGCGSCNKKCTVKFVEYPTDETGLPDTEYYKKLIH